MNKQQLASKIWESANKMRSKIEANEYKDLLQLEDFEFEVIRTASKGRRLFQCGNERYKLLVQAPEYKEVMFGTEGGR